MVRGVWGGVLWGGLLSAVALAVASQVGPPPTGRPLMPERATGPVAVAAAGPDRTPPTLPGDAPGSLQPEPAADAVVTEPTGDAAVEPEATVQAAEAEPVPGAVALAPTDADGAPQAEPAADAADRDLPAAVAVPPEATVQAADVATVPERAAPQLPEDTAVAWQAEPIPEVAVADPELHVDAGQPGAVAEATQIAPAPSGASPNSTAAAPAADTEAALSLAPEAIVALPAPDPVPTVPTGATSAPSVPAAEAAVTAPLAADAPRVEPAKPLVVAANEPPAPLSARASGPAVVRPAVPAIVPGVAPADPPSAPVATQADAPPPGSPPPPSEPAQPPVSTASDGLPASDAGTAQEARAEPDAPSAAPPADPVDPPDVLAKPAPLPPAPGLTGDAPGVRILRLPGTSGADAAQVSPDADADAATTDADDPPAEDTRPAIDRYARVFDNPAGKPVFAIVLIDSGEPTLDRAALAALPFPVTFVLDPSRPEAALAASIYRSAGQEVAMLATGLPEGATASDLEVTLGAYADVVPDAVAFVDPETGGFQGNRPVATLVAPIVDGQGRGLLSWDRGLNAADQVARREGLRSGVIYRRLDGEGEGTPMIRRYLDRAAFKAAQDGRVIVAGVTRPETVAALLEWAVEGRAATVALAPLSAALQAP